MIAPTSTENSFYFTPVEVPGVGGQPAPQTQDIGDPFGLGNGTETGQYIDLISMQLYQNIYNLNRELFADASKYLVPSETFSQLTWFWEYFASTLSSACPSSNSVNNFLRFAGTWVGGDASVCLEKICETRGETIP